MIVDRLIVGLKSVRFANSLAAFFFKAMLRY